MAARSGPTRCDCDANRQFGDLSPRARAALAAADLVAAEDTRRTGDAAGGDRRVARRCCRCTSTTRQARVAELIARLRRRRRSSRWSAMPARRCSPIPASLLVRAAARGGIERAPIPGPSAVTAALSDRGPADRPVRVRGIPAGARRANGATRWRGWRRGAHAGVLRGAASHRRRRWTTWRRTFGGDRRAVRRARAHQDPRDACIAARSRSLLRAGGERRRTSRAARSRSWSTARRRAERGRPGTAGASPAVAAAGTAAGTGRGDRRPARRRARVPAPTRSRWSWRRSED